MPVDQRADRGARASRRGSAITRSTSRASSAASGSRWRIKGAEIAAGAPAGRGGLAAGAHARAGRCARPRRSTTWTPSASSASTSATPPARRRRRRAWCSRTTGCRTREYRRYNIDGITPRRRLRRDAPGADAPLRQAGRGWPAAPRADGAGAPAGPGAGRRRARARWRWRARCSRSSGSTCR